MCQSNSVRQVLLDLPLKFKTESVPVLSTANTVYPAVQIKCKCKSDWKTKIVTINMLNVFSDHYDNLQNQL